jgi:hypothetical protein
MELHGSLWSPNLEDKSRAGGAAANAWGPSEVRGVRSTEDGEFRLQHAPTICHPLYLALRSFLTNYLQHQVEV